MEERGYTSLILLPGLWLGQLMSCQCFFSLQGNDYYGLQLEPNKFYVIIIMY